MSHWATSALPLLGPTTAIPRAFALRNSFMRKAAMPDVGLWNDPGAEVALRPALQGSVQYFDFRTKHLIGAEVCPVQEVRGRFNTVGDVGSAGEQQAPLGYVVETAAFPAQ